MGFFQRRAAERRDRDAKQASWEVIAQLAASDMAIGVLEVCLLSNQRPDTVAVVLRAVLADDAPRDVVAACMNRATLLDKELVRQFGVGRYSQVVTLLGAVYDADKVSEQSSASSYAELATLESLSDDERGRVMRYGEALDRAGTQYEEARTGPSGCTTWINSSAPFLASQGHPYSISVMRPGEGDLPLFVGSRELAGANALAARIRDIGYDDAMAEAKESDALRDPIERKQL